jgi:hypothetical protein
MNIAEVLVLITFGQLSALVLIGAGHVLHNRWLDRKLAPKKPVVIVQHQQVKP